MAASIKHFLLVFILLWDIRSYSNEVIISECGRPTADVAFNDQQWRVVGGREVNIGELPWQVYLNKTIHYQNYEFSSFCGATIVSKDYLLTGAHCIYDWFVSPDIYNVTLEAILGTVDLASSSSQLIKRSIVNVTKHERFDYENKLNDIALLRMDQSLDFQNNEKHLTPICIANTTIDSSKCISSGFGYRDKDLTQLDSKLFSVGEIIVNNSLCHVYFDSFNDSTNVCIEGSFNQGVCKGDSGGPFQCLNSNDNRWYQVGIVSYGIPCALDNVPDVLTRIDYYYDWILKNIY